MSASVVPAALADIRRDAYFSVSGAALTGFGGVFAGAGLSGTSIAALPAGLA